MQDVPAPVTPPPPSTPPRSTKKISIDDRNTHSFRVAHRATSSTREEAAQPARVEGPASPVQLTHHRLQSRFKSLVTDVTHYLRLHPTASMPDEFIQLAEDAIKSFKTIKVENGQAFKRSRTAVTSSPDLQVSVESIDPDDVKPRRERSASSVPRHVDPVVKNDTPKAGDEQASKKRDNAWSRPLNVNNREEVKEAQHGERLREALRADEKLADAEARRKLLVAERQQRHEAEKERASEARARREAYEAKVRSEIETKAQRAEVNRTQAVEKKKEFSVKDGAKSEEAAFVVAAEAANKAAELEERQRNLERNAEVLQAQRTAAARDRSEAHGQVVARAKSADKQRAELQHQRATVKEEQRLRHEAEKRRETESKHQKLEERREKVVEQQMKVQAEAEAKLNRAQERVELSEKHREELVSKLRERSEKADIKLREAKERRDREGGKTRVELPPKSEDDWRVIEENAGKATGLLLRHAKAFADEQSSFPAAANKAKCRVLLARLTGNAPSQIKAAFQDITAQLVPTNSAVEHHALRWQGGIPAACDAFMTKKLDAMTHRAGADLVVKFLTHPVERKANVEFFVTSGCVVKFIDALLDDFKRLHKAHMSANFAFNLLVLSCCIDYALIDVGDRPDMQWLGRAIADACEALDLYGVTLTLATVASADEMLPLFVALCGVRTLFSARQAKKDSREARAQLHDRMCHNLMACITNMLMPGGQTLKPDVCFAPWGSCVLFMSFRLLNDVARRDLRLMQSIVSSDMASTVFPHIVTAMTVYVSNHEADLEALPTTEASQDHAPSRQFAEALRAGVTINRVHPPDIFSSKKPPSFVRAAFHELLLLIGYVAINNSAVQDMFAYGSTTTLLTNVVAALPIAYFGVSKSIAFPSLLAICFRHRLNTSILRSEMDCSALVSFLKAEMEALSITPQVAVKSPAAAPQRISWAEMMDDDDADLFAAPGAVDPAEGERVAQHVARAVVAKQRADYTSFYRFDRRLATELWAEVLADLELLDH